VRNGVPREPGVLGMCGTVPKPAGRRQGVQGEWRTTTLPWGVQRGRRASLVPLKARGPGAAPRANEQDEWQAPQVPEFVLFSE